MRIRILGSAAGGGYPQWNCNCESCARVWRGEAKAQTQVSLAVTADDEHWFLLNASPDLRAQILGDAGAAAANDRAATARSPARC